MGQPPDRYLPALICLGLVLATAAVYWHVQNNNFIDFDDPLYVTENRNIQAGLTSDAIKWAFTTSHAYNWHPVTWLSHILDFRLFGLNPRGHHLTNLIFHVANTLLLFLVLRLMTNTLWRSAFVAALFALHPLHVESVAWVSERKDVLSTFFWLLTIWFYIRYTRIPKFNTYFPVMAVFAVGLMAKQMLVTLPFVLLLLDYWPLDRFVLPQKERKNKISSTKKTFYYCLLEKLPLLVLSFSACLIVLYVQSKAALVRSQIPVINRLGNVIMAYIEYILKMFYPVHLGILYPYPLTGPVLWKVAAGGGLLLCITIAVLRFSKNRRWLVVGWFWFVGTLVPVIGIVQVGLQAIADRYTYVPLIGLFIILAWATPELTEKLRYQKAILAVSALVILSSLSVLTYKQVFRWKDSITLFEYTAAVTEDNDIMHYSLGRLLLARGDVEQTIFHWTEALRIKPDQPTIHKQLAVLFTQRGDIDGAIDHYREVLKYRPDDAFSRNNLQKLLAIRDSPANKPKATDSSSSP